MRKKIVYFYCHAGPQNLAGQGTSSSVAHLLLRSWGRRPGLGEQLLNTVVPAGSKHILQVLKHVMVEEMA